MPGPSNFRGKLVTLSLNSGKISQSAVDERIRALLKLINTVMKSGIPENAPEGTRDTQETSQLLRHISASSIVLLKNDQDMLPLKKEKTVNHPQQGVSGSN